MPPPSDQHRRWQVTRLGTPAEALALDAVPPREPRAGEVRVQVGAAGGVGSAAVQLAAEPDPAGLVAHLTGGRGADIVVDVVGGEGFGWVRRCAAFEGRIVLTGFTSGSFGTVPANHVLLRNYSVTGLHLALYRREDPALLRRVHERLLRLYAAGAIRPLIYQELSFDQAPAGLELLAARAVIGRVALRC